MELYPWADFTSTETDEPFYAVVDMPPGFVPGVPTTITLKLISSFTDK
jgi:hypothetical protein